MREFGSLKAFAAHIERLAVASPVTLHETVVVACRVVERKAKDLIGHPQDQWPPLADRTIADKQRLGFTAKDDYSPLLRTGDLRDSISFEVEGLKGVVGSTDQVMVYHEFGTKNMPPRSVLTLATVSSRKKLDAVFGAGAARCFVGNVIPKPKEE
jgi:phage gpG-like protein